MPDTQKLKPFISTWKFNCIAGTFCIKVKFLGNDFEQLVTLQRTLKPLITKKYTRWTMLRSETKSTCYGREIFM